MVKWKKKIVLRTGVSKKMYAYFYGEITEKEEDNIVIEVGNIGYNIRIAPALYNRIPPVGETIKIYTYTSVREDAFQLYGFLTKEDLKLFKLLITVSGIGPKGAMGLLSVMDADTIKMAILSQDTKTIAKAPGIGTKSAGRIILELKDKIKPEDLLGESKTETKDSCESETAAQIRQEATEALGTLGYSVSEVFRVLRNIEISEETKVEDVIKEALKRMI
ncbi:MAG: Holliday junction branch migration protein RuvA [Lachnospiraceae bacterium]|nr:Holliday junction branch migration protein RuvA [Lachnospiraceae bacterium]